MFSSASLSHCSIVRSPQLFAEQFLQQWLPFRLLRQGLFGHWRACPYHWRCPSQESLLCLHTLSPWMQSILGGRPSHPPCQPGSVEIALATCSTRASSPGGIHTLRP